jgi:hypothetical protein
VPHERLFFVVTIGALLVVLAIFAVIVLVLGDDDDQGGNINRDLPPRSAPGQVSLVISTETSMAVVAAPE